MASSSLNEISLKLQETVAEGREELFCRIRRTWVAATPEERVRQAVLTLLIERLGFPSSLLSVEKEFRGLPHLKSMSRLLPRRRADILCFTSSSEGVRPLLLVECKANEITSKALTQVLSYNLFIEAAYVAVSNARESRMAWVDKKGKRHQVESFCPYELLVKGL